MTAASYGPTRVFTIHQEGGYTNRETDSGNWSSGQCGKGELIGSNMGCGAPATIAYMAETQPGFQVTAAWMQNLPLAVYDGMAQTRYWRPLSCDTLPAGLDLMCFDFGWNTGIGSAARRLQVLLGAHQDGYVGPETIGRIKTIDINAIAHGLEPASVTTLQMLLRVAADGDVGPVTLAALAAKPSIWQALLILRLGELQAAYYRTLYNFAEDGDGWLNRTGARVTAALALIATS